MTPELTTERPEALLGLFFALARSAGSEPLPHAVTAALIDAARQHPQPLAASWVSRLAHAGEHLGLRVAAFEATPAELVELGNQHGPLATCLPALADQEPAWLLLDTWLGPKVKISGTAAHQPGAWIDADTLATLLGLPNRDTPVLWVLAEPATTAAPLLRGGAYERPTPGERLRSLMRLEADDIWVIAVYAVGVGVFALATPIAVQALVNTVAFGALIQPLVVLTVLLLFALIFAAALRGIQYWVVELLQQRLFARIVSDLGYRLPRLHASAFDKAHGPELVNRFYDLITVQKSAASLLLDGLSVALQAGIGMIVLAFYHPLLLTFDIFLITAVALIIFGWGKGATYTSLKESAAKHEVAAWLQEIARAPVTFKRAGGANFALQRADELTRRYLDARRKHFRYLYRQIVGALSLQAIASAALLGLGGWLVIDRQLTLGQLVAAELIVSSVVSAFAKFGKHLESYYDLAAAIDKLGILADLPLENDTGESTPPHPRPIELHLEGVSMHYEGHRPALREVDLAIAPGEAVAITGASGACKSTFGALLYGLREPTAGVIKLDGVDLRDIALASVRRDIALVGAIELFAGTIIDNVRMSRRDIPLAEIRRVLYALGLAGALASLPDDLNTHIQVGGSPLSRSESLRLVLARALLGRPRLLILDETLDLLDDRTREAVLALILADDAPWTALIITTKQSVMDRCDRAFELRDGHLRQILPPPPAPAV
jgi:putative ABC transport system ATP-binding protein